MTGLRLVLSFLTRLPVGKVESADYLRDVGRSAGLFPAAGLFVGGVMLLAHLGSGLLFGPAVTAAVTLAAGLWASGGLHLDGLMDTADGVLSGRSRERMLEILKDSRVGVMGVAAGVLALLLRFCLFLELPAASAPAALLVAPALGRMVIPLAATAWPSARAGEGLGASFAAHVGRAQVLTALLSGLAIALAVPAGLAAALPAGLPAALSGAAGGLPGTGLMALRGVCAWAVALSAGLAVGRSLANRLGGLTGDTYGALSELAELAALACFAAQVGGGAAP